MKTINITLKIEPEHLNGLEEALRKSFTVIDYKILPNTEKLYAEDKHFKKMVKRIKAEQRARDKYINEHNYK